MKYETITKAASLLRDAACSLWSQSYSDWYNAQRNLTLSGSSLNTMQSFEEWSKTELQLIKQLNNTASELEEEWNEE